MSWRSGWRVLSLAIGWAVVVGPWPARDTPLTTGPPFRDTVARLDGKPVRSGPGMLRAGVAEVPLVPPAPVPLAGFLDQIAQPYVGVNSPCFARALTLAQGQTSVTILTADVLLIDARLVRLVLNRTGLRRDQIYFTATHTHSGPGGWGNHPLERLVAGTYDPELVDFLAKQLARVVVASRSKLVPAAVAFVRAEAKGLQQNRILPGRPTDDRLSAWIVRGLDADPRDPPLATLAIFGAHATVGHPRPGRLGGDYPAAFAATLHGRGHAGMVLFAAGTVGDASPVRPRAANQQQSVQLYGDDLAGRLETLMAAARFHREIELANLGLEVDLPPVQVPFLGPQLRFSPLATWWVGPPRTYLHVVRIGPAILAGFPGDIAGHLAEELDSSPLPVVATSFNGDYKGYLVTRATFRDTPWSCYETRWMSFFGGSLGEVLVDLTHKSIRRILATGG